MKSINFNNASFTMGVTKANAIMKSDLKEVAIVGRSNVGKSSLINLLTGHNKLAKVSNTPGRTQQINYFNIDNHFLLIDLPGYGYAKLSKKEHDKINCLISDYLNSSRQIQLVLLVIDVRHELKTLDLEMIKFLSKLNIKTEIILNKGDKKDTKEEYWHNQLMTLKKQYGTIMSLASLPIKADNPESVQNIRNSICSVLLK